MQMYFHTSGGDNLLFKSWAPSSPGAIAGASVAIFFLAILERLVGGLRGQLAAYWTSRALERPIQEDTSSCRKSERPSSSDGSKSIPASRKRTVPPFILAHDLPRGIVCMIQAAIAYLLMLIVMFVLSHSDKTHQHQRSLFFFPTGPSKFGTSSQS
ncbi:Ctr copper transporter family-domain-containing protein [Thelephora terrestris]|uniref:Copper transport protein n=1 Tax=Thelephora terrestris TaxID=56493 RepID=A0A9P6HKI6_9AGAM|nr:Ctr copper transporter family-domain-containing protein [Thelephora terrestris]